jgi:hypothetical protein
MIHWLFDNLFDLNIPDNFDWPLNNFLDFNNLDSLDRNLNNFLNLTNLDLNDWLLNNPLNDLRGWLLNLDGLRMLVNWLPSLMDGLVVSVDGVMGMVIEHSSDGLCGMVLWVGDRRS